LAFNGHDLMVVKVKGEFVWHQHDDTDDFFLVLKGPSKCAYEIVVLGPGEIFVVPIAVLSLTRTRYDPCRLPQLP